MGKHISKIPNRHKSYFNVDNKGFIISYSRKISIDKVILKARLNKDEIDNILATFKYHIQHKILENGYKIINFIVDLTKEFGVYIKLFPHESSENSSSNNNSCCIKNSINAEIQLHPQFTLNLGGNSPVITDILANPKWFITRLDIATDYVTPYSTSAYLRSHGNKKQKNYDTSSWCGSTSNKNKKVCDSHYNRAALDENISSNFTNRFELKLFFKESDNMSLHSINHEIIVVRLKKEMFIPCLTYSFFNDKSVSTSIGNKSYIELIKKAKQADNDNVIKSLLTPAQWRTFRKKFKESRDDIEQAYLMCADFIFDFRFSYDASAMR